MRTVIPQVRGIYRIVCISTGGFYIGSALNIHRRFKKHTSYLRRRAHPNPKLQAAWDKYGEDKFCVEVVEIVSTDKLLFDREQYYLDLLQPRFNINPKADNSWLGRNHTEESKIRIGDAHRGKVMSPESRAKISKAKMGNKDALGSKGLVGYKHSEQSRRNMSEAQKKLGKKLSESQKKALISSVKGKKKSPEQIAKMSAARKVWWDRKRVEDPNYSTIKPKPI